MEASDSAHIRLNTLCTLNAYHQSAKENKKGGRKFPFPLYKLDKHTPCESKFIPYSPRRISLKIPKDDLNPRMLNWQCLNVTYKYSHTV